MLISLLALSLTFFPLGESQRALGRCLNLYSKESCFALYNPLKTSLLSSERNLFELNQAFYPLGAFASTSLINVLYTVEFTASRDSSSLPLPCPEINVNRSPPVDVDDRARFLAGWSSTGVFNIISPLELSKLQLQLLNELYSLFVVPGGGIALPGRFGWKVMTAKGAPVSLLRNNILELNLTMDLSNVSCIPNLDLTKRVLQDITLFLKVYASTEGRPPERIEEQDLGFATGPGADIEGAILTTFSQTFSSLFVVSSVLLGLCVFMVSSVFFPKVYKHFSTGRRQFGYYFTALSIVAFFCNVTIISFEIYKLPSWCNTTFMNSQTGEEEMGCDSTIIVEVTYQLSAVIFSLIAALVIFFTSFLKQHRGLEGSSWFRKTRYVVGFWMIILFLTLITWAVIPSILFLFVYPSIVIALNALIIAALFWSTVMMSIPLLFVHNLYKNPNCLAVFQYLIRLGALSIASLMTGFLTFCYLSATVFGSGVGGIVGISIALLPSLLLTIFSENYRDWVLTNETDRTAEPIHLGKIGSLKLETPHFLRSKSTSNSVLKSMTGTSSQPEEGESVLERHQMVLHPNGSGQAKDGLELRVMGRNDSQQEQDSPQTLSGKLPEILVKESQGTDHTVTHEQASEQLTASEDRGSSLPGKASLTGVPYKGLQRNSEPSHSFIRTVSNFYRRKK